MFTHPHQIAAAAEQRRRKLITDAPQVISKKRLSRLQWAFEYRPMLSADLPFDLTEHKYLTALYEDEAQEITVKKAGQMGASEFMVTDCLWLLEHLGINVLTLFPDDGMISDFSQSRIGPALEESVSPKLAASVTRATGRKRGADKTHLKRIGNAFWFLRGARLSGDGHKSTSTKLHSAAVGAVQTDELDLVDPRALPKARERLGHSLYKFWRTYSTPTYSDVGIDAEYKASDMRVWFIKCGRCGEWVLPELRHLILEWDDLKRPTAWNKTPEGAPCLRCKCGAALDRTSAGEWVISHHDRPIHGYHISGLIAPRKGLEEIIGSRVGNKPTGLQSIVESERKEIYNQKIGEVYKSDYAATLDNETLDACRRNYAPGPVKDRRYIAFCGVDVGRVLNVIIRGSDWRLLAALEVKDFSDLPALLSAYNVVCTVIDLAPESKSVRAFQALMAQRTKNRTAVWGATYFTAADGIKDFDSYRWNENELYVTMDRTRTIDAMLSYFRVAARGEAKGATLPATFSAENTPDYYNHMKAPERKTIKNARGIETVVYDEGSKPDHYFHAENYCLAAAEWWVLAMQQQYGVTYDPVRIL